MQKVDYDNLDINILLKEVMGNNTEAVEFFYNKYDKLVWDLATQRKETLSIASKGQLGVDDIHSELWIHIFKRLPKYDSEKSSLKSFIGLVCDNKMGMLARAYKSRKNNLSENESNYSLDASIKGDSSSDSDMLIANLISDGFCLEEDVESRDLLLDFIYASLELIDSCTDKERKIYLYKIEGRKQSDIAEAADVSPSYVPKVCKKLKNNLKKLYKTLDTQMYINKEERNMIAKDLLNDVSDIEICKKYDLELDTVNITRTILKIVGVA